MQWELLLLGFWFLVIALKRFFENIHHMVYSLLEESLDSFEDAEFDELNATSSPIESPRGESEGLHTRKPSTSCASVNPSSLPIVVPSERRAETVEVTSSIDFREEEVWRSLFKDPS